MSQLYSEERCTYIDLSQLYLFLIALMEMDHYITGQWDKAADSRKTFYTLDNAKNIAYDVKQHITFD